jgi:hypothetical protein
MDFPQINLENLTIYMNGQDDNIDPVLKTTKKNKKNMRKVSFYAN